MTEDREIQAGEEQGGDSLVVALAALEFKLAEVQREIKRLKNYARGLEEENQRLRSMMTEAVTGIQGQERLRLLYEQGYHVCPAQFGRVRGSQGCLFCLSFLEKRG
ncbi:initiation control protein YabA [Moorellaceae bacterium AZ2]